MAWEKGIQKDRLQFCAEATNKKILDIDGFLQEDEAKVLLYEFLRNNIMYSTDLFLGVKLFPFQALAIKSMMVADYSMYVFSRGLSKTYSTAIFCMMQCALKQNANIGIISASFRQAKQIFQKMEDILSKPSAKLVADCLGKNRGFVKGTDQWQWKVGNSRVTALPLANGERLRGFRFNIIVLDEFLLIPEPIFNEVITPFLSVIENPDERQELYDLETKLIEEGKMDPKDRYVWPNNKLILLSSPSFKFEYMYKLYKQYEALIFGQHESQYLVEDEVEEDDAYRVVMQLAYDMAPTQLYDRNLLKQAKATMSEMQFKREFGAQFVDESDGYFRLSKMLACTIPDGQTPAVEIVGNPKDEYIIAFDPNWSSNSSADHFAMQVIKIDKEKQQGVVVHSYGVAGLDLKFHIFYFYYLLTHFNVIGLCGDYNGGVQFINACNESELFKSSSIHIGVLEGVDLTKPDSYQEELLQMKNSYNITKRHYCILRTPTTSWIRQANELLQGAIDHQRILFAARSLDQHFDYQTKQELPIDQIKWDIKLPSQSPQAAKIDFLEHQKTMIELTKVECANIEVTVNPQGTQTFDLPQQLKRQKGENRARKDSYSALVLGNWFMKIYFEMLNTKQQSLPTATFEPFMV